MTDIGHIGTPSSADILVAPGRQTAETPEAQQTRSTPPSEARPLVLREDSVEISDDGQRLSSELELQAAEEAGRTGKVNRIDAARASVRNGSIDTPENLELALSRMMDEIDDSGD
jgi:hypothetical protein